MQTDEYIALSRKYRPMNFDDVSGHDAMITILKNQISSGKLADAYLFIGMHGTGKTTLARIFAKSLNCDAPVNGNPCNKCISCKEITSSASLNVIEIDGASNRGIDDIRNINETVGYATVQGKYKIYIIDEVHMLTKEAFNALLKTLEEPPPNTKFFLATTEAHKIPLTILSRCQKIELSRISQEEIQNKLKSITDKMSVKIDSDALCLISRFAEGSMRDAESLLENIIGYSKDISAKDVYTSLGMCEKNIFFAIDEAFKTNDQSMPFTLSPKLFSSHTNLTSLIDELCMHFKFHAYTLINKKNDHALFFTEEEKKQYSLSGSFYTIEQLLEILHILADTYHYNFTPISKQIHVEMILHKILSCKFAKSPEDILTHLEQIKDEIQKAPVKQTAHNTNSTSSDIKQPPSPGENTPISTNQSIARKSSVEKDCEKKNIPVEHPSTTVVGTLNTDKQEKIRQENILQFASVEMKGKITKNI